MIEVNWDQLAANWNGLVKEAQEQIAKQDTIQVQSELLAEMVQDNAQYKRAIALLEEKLAHVTKERDTNAAAANEAWAKMERLRHAPVVCDCPGLVEELQIKVKRLTQHNANQAESIHKLLTARDRQTEANVRAGAEIERLQQQLAELHREMRAATDGLTKGKVRIDELNASNSRLGQQLDFRNKEVQDLRKAVADAQQKLECPATADYARLQLQRQVGEVKAQLENAQRAVHAAEERATKAHEAANKRVATVVEESNAKVAAARQERDEANAKLKQAQTTLEWRGRVRDQDYKRICELEQRLIKRGEELENANKNLATAQGTCLKLANLRNEIAARFGERTPDLRDKSYHTDYLRAVCAFAFGEVQALEEKLSQALTVNRKLIELVPLHKRINLRVTAYTINDTIDGARDGAKQSPSEK